MKLQDYLEKGFKKVATYYTNPEESRYSKTGRVMKVTDKELLSDNLGVYIFTSGEELLTIGCVMTKGRVYKRLQEYAYHTTGAHNRTVMEGYDKRSENDSEVVFEVYFLPCETKEIEFAGVKTVTGIHPKHLERQLAEEYSRVTGKTTMPLSNNK